MTNFERIERKLARESLIDFVKIFWGSVETVEMDAPWIIEYFCECFMWTVRQFLPDDIKRHWIPDNEFNKILKPEYKNIRMFPINSRTIKHFNINIPPRHSKSLIFNVFGPTWLFTLFPVKAASVSYNQTLSSEMNQKRQRILSSEKYGRLFPEIILTQNQMTKIIGAHNGELYSVPMSSIGWGGDIIINDDLVTPDAASRDAKVLQNAITFYKETMPSRLNTRETGLIINIQQRLAMGDITGTIKSDRELRDKYIFIEVKAIATEDETFIFPCSGRLINRKEGDFLWPKRFGDYSALKAEVGDKFEPQYQQNPIASKLSIIQPKHIRAMSRVEAQEILDDPDEIYSSLDFPVKGRDVSDYLGSIIAFKKGKTLLIVEAMMQHMSYTESRDYVRNLSERFVGILQIIEDRANGTATLDDLKGDVSGLIPFEIGSKSKTDRLDLASKYMIAGNVYFLSDENYDLKDDLKIFVEHLMKFPMLEHDDDVDAFSQLVIYVFSATRVGIFTDSFDSKNIINSHEANKIATEKKKELIGAVMRFGLQWRAIKMYWSYKEKIYYIVDEYVKSINDSQALDELKIFFEGCRYIIDSSDGEVLINGIGRKLRLISAGDNKRRITSKLSQLKSAFITKSLKISHHCVETKRDIISCRLDSTALRDGQEKFDGNPGIISCITDLIFMTQGDLDF